MKTGDRVAIYQKPLTEEELEGYALVKDIERTDEITGLHYCTVQFEGDEEVPVFRTVKIK